MNNTKGSIMLLITAFIWGTAFVAQSVGMDHIEPFTFNGIRNFVGAIALLPVILYNKKFSKINEHYDTKTLWAGGISCGIILAIASTLQQIGIVYTTSGKAGFITALYIIFVPLFSLFTKKKPSKKIWISVFLAIFGMYLLCVKDAISLNKGDIYIFFCAIAFTFHIMVIDRFSPKVDGVKMSCIQFLVCGTICTACMFIFEQPTLNGITSATIPILYTGVMSSGVAYTLQIVAQKFTAPTLATLIMSLESVFAAVSGWIILEQAMSASEIIGSVLVFVAILIAQFV